MKTGKVVLVLGGRFAGRKAVIVKVLILCTCNFYHVMLCNQFSACLTIHMSRCTLYMMTKNIMLLILMSYVYNIINTRKRNRC